MNQHETIKLVVIILSLISAVCAAAGIIRIIYIFFEELEGEGEY